MLTELHVENLLLIERAELRLGPGLNVLTGETGAGKTVLAHALDLLLGGRARGNIVRPGAAEAWVEGSFALSPQLRELVGERLPPDADELVLARRVSAEGRTRAYVGGRSATAADLQEIGAAVLSFYGQHEHRRLTLASSQLDILDGFCGPEQVERRRSFASAHAAERLLQRRLHELRERAGARERELDLLIWELEEIEQADPSAEEEERLVAERERLRHIEGLQAASAMAMETLAPDSDGGGAVAALAAAGRALDSVRGIDAALDELGSRLDALGVEADDLAGGLRQYTDSLLGDAAASDESGSTGQTFAAQLDRVEERLGLLGRLKRKHGGTVDAVLAHAETCRRRREELEGAEEALSDVERQIDAARAALAERAAALHEARAIAAGLLETAVCQRLGALAMPGAAFHAALNPRDHFGPTGADEVEFLIAPNPGVPPGPLRDTASGGELSRIMLALMSVAAEAGPATLVFDEIDAGIGGQTARAVGDQLRELARGRQIICITHLPQIASLGERHFTIVKDASGDTALTTVTELSQADVVGELVRMLGADDGDRAARRHAQELLRAA